MKQYTHSNHAAITAPDWKSHSSKRGWISALETDPPDASLAASDCQSRKSLLDCRGANCRLAASRDEPELGSTKAHRRACGCSTKAFAVLGFGASCNRLRSSPSKPPHCFCCTSSSTRFSPDSVSRISARAAPPAPRQSDAAATPAVLQLDLTASASPARPFLMAWRSGTGMTPAASVCQTGSVVRNWSGRSEATMASNCMALPRAGLCPSFWATAASTPANQVKCSISRPTVRCSDDSELRARAAWTVPAGRKSTSPARSSKSSHRSNEEKSSKRLLPSPPVRCERAATGSGQGARHTVQSFSPAICRTNELIESKCGWKPVADGGVR
eukprot:m.49694 g.49694  ORF g.49694 m.49694 type:complete len:329 (-) comp6491_c0_seq3:726-1712(-)